MLTYSSVYMPVVIIMNINLGTGLAIPFCGLLDKIKHNSKI